MTNLSARWRLETLADLASGGLFKDGDWVESKDQDPSGHVRLTQLADVGVGVFRNRSDRWMRGDQAASLNCTFLEPNDIIIARMPEPLGRACLVPARIGSAVTAVDVAIVRLKRADLDPRFVMWALNSPDARSKMVRMQSGTTRKRISRKNLGLIQVPVPPLDEQRRIVEILEDHLSRLDAATDATATASRRTHALTRRNLDLAVTGKAPTATPGAGHESLGRGWRWTTIDEITNGARSGVVIGPFGSSLKTSDYRDQGVPLIFVRNVRSAYFGPWARKYVSHAKALELSSHVVQNGDVLITKMGDPPGDAAVYTSEEAGIVTADVIRLRPSPAYQAQYLAMAFNSGPVRHQIERITRGVAQRKVSLARFRGEVLVPAPPLIEQNRIVEQLLQTQSGLSRLQLACTSSERRSEDLRRGLLRAAFAGQLTGEGSRDLGARR